MALVLNEEQNMLRDAAKDFCSKRSPVSALRKLRDQESGDGFDREVWRQMVELGWPGIIIPEQYGGLDFGVQGMAVVMEECGRQLVASPLLSTSVLCASALTACDNSEIKSDLLERIASGDLLMAMALEESVHHAPTEVSTLACLASGDTDRDGVYLLSGSKQFVLDGHVADKFIVSARTEDDETLELFLLDASTQGLAVTRTAMVDNRNAAVLHLRDAPAQLLTFEGGASAALEQILDIARISLSAEMLGSCREAFERTLAYLKEREQFGVVIGSFQALKHRAAEMFTEIELSQSAIMGALTALDEQSGEAPALVSLAKAKISESLNLVTNEAVQMHGGIGMTDEHEIGFYMKRARVCEQSFGNVTFHRNRYGELGGY